MHHQASNDFSECPILQYALPPAREGFGHGPHFMKAYGNPHRTILAEELYARREYAGVGTATSRHESVWFES